MSGFYNTGKGEILKGNVDLVTDAIYYAFMKASYTPNFDTEEFLDDVSANIAGGSTAAELTSRAVNVDTVNNRAEFDAADLSLASQTFTDASDKILIYKHTGVAGTSTLLCSADITSIQPVSGTVTVAWNAEGIFSI